MNETSGNYDRRNFLINLSEGALFIAGASFISTQTVLPALIYRLGGGNVAVGAVSVLAWLGLYLPQLFAARYAQTQPIKKYWAIRLGFYQRMIIPLIIMAVLIFGESRPLLALSMLFIFYGAYQILTGLATPFWFDMYAKLTPVRLRGRLSGMRTALAGTAGFLGALFLTWLFTRFGFPENFALAFTLTFLFQIASIILQYRLVEEYPSKAFPEQSFSEYTEQLRLLLRQDKVFRRFLLSIIPLTLATMPMGFFIVYGMNNFKTGEGLIGQSTLLMVVGQGVGALVNGFLADRFGNKIAMISAAGTLACASALAFLASSIETFQLVFIVMGMNIGSELMIRHNLALEYSPNDQRSTYIGLMNTVLAPLYLSGLFGGWISDCWGYPVLFIIGGVCSVAGIILVAAGVDEPRKQKK